MLTLFVIVRFAVSGRSERTCARHVGSCRLCKTRLSKLVLRSGRSCAHRRQRLMLVLMLVLVLMVMLLRYCCRPRRRL